MTTYRAGIIGFGHMHINHVAKLYAEHPQVELVACADTQPLVPEARVAPYTRQWNLQHVMSGLGIPRQYEDYREMLAREKLDIAVVTCENGQHAEVVSACAAAGVHVCVEKPMAASLADALRMYRAARAAGTRMIVNWPVSWRPAIRKAKDLLAAGAIGRVLEVRCRIGHTGPLGSGATHRGVSETAAPMTGPERAATWWHQSAAGGGALLDFCCYGAMLARWYIGQPAVAVFGLKANLDSQWGEAEDNAVLVVRFPNAFADCGGSWTTRHDGGLSLPTIFGTEGTMRVENHEDRPFVHILRGGEQTEVAAGEPLPAGRANVAEEFVHHLATGEPVHETLQPEFNLEVMAILDAGRKAALGGKMELVASPAWPPT